MPRPTTTATSLAFAAIYIIWGTTFLCITLMLRTLPPFVGGGLRFVVASTLLYAWLRWREPHPFRGLNLLGTALCGVLLTGMGNGFLIWSQIALPSGVASLFVGSLPVWMLLLDGLFFSRRPPRPLAALGVAIGLAGVVVLSLHTQSLSGAVRPVHVAAVLVAELAWALGTLLQPRFAPSDRAVNFTCGQMLAGSLFQLLLASLGNEWRGFSFAQVSWVSWGALAWMILLGSIVAFSSYAFLVTHVAPQKIATYALVNPVIALVLGAVILGERVTPAALVSMALVLTGVALVLSQRGRPAQRDAPGPLAAGNADR